MEIERKYLVAKENLPINLEDFEFYEIEQAYLCREPVVRIRKQDNEYILTYKSKGLMVREEYNLPLTEESYQHLLAKSDGKVITKRRYIIPLRKKYKVELDIFEGVHKGLVLAEVEFETKEQAEEFVAPGWFGEEVTFTARYHNSTLSM